MDKNNKMNNIKISNHLALDIAVSASEGEKIYTLLHSLLSKFQKEGSDERLELDFSDIKVINTAFLNVAIGRLYSSFDSAFLNKHLEIRNISSGDEVYLRKTIETAKEYYKDKENFNKDASTIMNND